MDDIKISLTIEIPSNKMVSKEESLKSIRKPVLNQRGKPIYRNDGKPVINVTQVAVPSKNNKCQITVKAENKQRETLVFYTRKQEPISQVINMNTDAYNYFVSRESAIKPYSLISWRKLKPNERIRIHCENIAEHLGGVLKDFYVFED